LAYLTLYADKSNSQLQDTNKCPYLRQYIQQIPTCLAGVKMGRVHLCRVASNTVIQYGK